MSGISEKPNQFIEPHDSARIFLIAVLVNLCVQLVFALAVGNIQFSSAETETLVNLLGSLLIQSAYCAVYFYVIRNKNTQLVYSPKNKIKPLSAVLSGFAALTLLAALYLPTVWVTAGLNRIGYSTPPLALSPVNLAVCVVTVVLVAPTVEELIFRGILLSGLSRNGIYKAVFLTALAFSLSHFNPEQTFFPFFVGALCGLLVIFTGSLWAGIIAHAANNLFVVLLGVGPLSGLMESFSGFLSQNTGAAIGLTAANLIVFGGLTVFILWAVKRVGRGKTTLAEDKTEGKTDFFENSVAAGTEISAAKKRSVRAYLLLGYTVAAFVWLTILVSVILS